MLELSDVRAGYDGIQVLHGVDLRVDEGEIVALVGSNGAGKTTTTLTISGLLAPTGGSITYRDEEIGGRSPHEIVDRGIVQVPEDRDLFTGMSVRENLELGAQTASAREGEAATLERMFDLFPRLEDRASQVAGTMSGGEQQMLTVARALMGDPDLLILDEPSIGLHQRDNDRLLNTLAELRDLGNTLLVVEHDEETMRRADNIIDMGPGPGKRGGEVVVNGDQQDVIDCEDSVTGEYLSGERQIPVPDTRRDSDGALTVEGARQHNLADLDVDLPLGNFTAITGVSGSGKSTLMHDVLYKGLVRRMNDTDVNPGEHDDIEGIDEIETVRLIDQSPIGRTPRSNPATYTNVFDHIRELFAETSLAKQRGYEKGRFSFNVKGGRCEACGGQGNVKIEMNFLSDVYVPCEECDGARYNDETLDVTYKDATIADVLDMEVEEAYEFFEGHTGIRRRLKLLKDVGLGYMQLGQPSTTLSGGEAQRIKLAEELGKKDTGETLYLLDEPTTGLHHEDERKLIDVLHRLTDEGNTVVVIEHELDLVKNADHIVDLGPEGGENGGTIVAEGTPEDVARNDDSYTGQYLRDLLPKVELEGPRADRDVATPAADDD